jgi:bifunctional DNase/RNase
MLEVTVKCVMKEPMATRYLMLLETKDGNKIIPIHIGSFEAEAIYTKLNNIQPPKPMTYDFFSDILSQLDDVSIKKIIIDDVDKDIYSAYILLQINNKESSKLFCRPSDAIALGLRQQVPLFVDKKVIEKTNCVSKDCICDRERELIEEIIADQETSYWNI